VASLAHELEYLATLGATKYVQRLSDEKADRMGIGLGRLMYRVLHKRRKVAFDNLKQALGSDYSDEQLEEISRKVFANIGQTLVEFSRFKQLGREGVRRIITGPGEENIAKAYAEGKGGILLTAHFGNWEILGAWVAALGYPMDFLVGRQHNAKVDRLLLGFRSEMKVGLIPLATAARSVFKALKANHITGIVADQHAPGGSVVLDFFGRPCAWAKGPSLFAIRAGAPLLPYLLRRERFDRHVLMPGEPIYPPNSGDEEKDIETMIVAYARFLENGIRAYPDQWMWTHRRWKLDTPAT
jgi:KDO2-lipid IV(A) lauroyltransferase